MKRGFIGFLKFCIQNPKLLAECFIEAFVAMFVSALITFGILALVAVMVNGELIINAELLLLLFTLITALVVPCIKLFKRGD